MLSDVFAFNGHFRDWLPFLKKYGNIGVELYNIRQDPAEIINLADEQADLVKELKSLLDSWIKCKLKGREDPILSLKQYTQPQPKEYQGL